MSGYYDNQQAYQQGYPQHQYQQTAYTGSEQYSTYPSQGFAQQTYDSQPQDQHRYYQSSNPSSYSQSYDPSYQSQFQTQYGQQSHNPEADRGVLGALGGGAAGGFAGHKVGHGFLGTIGGAIVGSLTEDFAKQKHKKRHGRKDGHLPNGGYGGNAAASGGLGSMASSFFTSQKK